MLPLWVRVDLGALAISKAGALPSDCLMLYLGYSLGGGLTPLCILQLQPTRLLCICGYMYVHTHLLKKIQTQTYICRYMHQSIKTFISTSTWRCPWCNGYCRRKWTRRHEFKSWTRLITFHIALIPLGKVWIQLFSLQLWVNSRAD